MCKFFSRSRKLQTGITIALLLLCGKAFAETLVLQGKISEFNGPDDLQLDPAVTVVAIDLNGDQDRIVNGVTFLSDQNPIDNVTITATNAINGWTTRPNYSGEDQTSVDNLELIMQDIRWSNAPNTLTIDIAGLTPGKEYLLQFLTNEGRRYDRRWDIGIEGDLVVDDFTSEGDGTWNSSNGFVYENTVILDPEDSVLNITFAPNLGGQPLGGQDNNPLLQAFIISEVAQAPSPSQISLSRQEFFHNQTAEIATLSAEDSFVGAKHIFSLPEGVGDNAKFAIDDHLLVKSPSHDFSQDPIGSSYSLSIRATDTERPERFLDQVFQVTLQQEEAPTDLKLSANSLSLGAIPGSVVAYLSTVDLNEFDAFTYRILIGNDSEFFGIDGDQLLLTTTIPEGTTSLSVQISSQDLSGLSIVRNFELSVTPPTIRINEIVASNATGLIDEDGDSSDWIEIFNELTEPLSLNGWYLTDDESNPTKWTLPDISLAQGEYILIFASEKNRTPNDRSEIHTNFALSASGGYLALIQPDGVTIASQLNYPESYPDVSYGQNTTGTKFGFLQQTTPREANGETALNVVNTVNFSHQRGLYTETFELELTASLEGSIIRYTTNGERPSASHGSIYSGPIDITPETNPLTRGTRRIRAIALNSTAAVSPVSSHSYIWVNGTSLPSANGVIGQSSFSTTITEDPVYSTEMSQGLLALPVISIMSDGSVGSNEDIASIELISHDGSESGFHIDCGMKIVGGNSTNSAKNNFRCYFRGRYGASKLKYDLFRDHPYTEGASDEFDVLQLRGGSHDNFFWMARPSLPPISLRHGDAQYTRNRWVSDVQMLMGQPSLHGRYVHCYLNGVYHGLYHIHERPAHNYMDKYFGGDPEDYHYTNATKSGSDHGNGDNWQATWNQVKIAASQGGQSSRSWINWQSLADYQLLAYYCGNDWDWKVGQNWMAAGPKSPDEGGWRFFAWDQDVTIYDTRSNNLGKTAPDGVFHSLMNDVDFQTFFRDRVYHHCFNGGLLSKGALEESHSRRMNEIFYALVPETARWQPIEATNLPWDRDEEWQTEWDYVRNTFFQDRTPILIQQLKDKGWYPVDAPQFAPRGGQIESGSAVSVSAPSGTTYITKDGSDPRLPGGQIHSSAIALNTTGTIETVVPLGSSWRYLDDGSQAEATWKTQSFSDAAWSVGAAELGYGDGDEQTNISYGTNEDQKHITTYFRHSFTATDIADITGIILRMRRDDGAIVYLNGTEIWRSNMPDGDVTSTTFAMSGIGGASESTLFGKSDTPVTLLDEGVNVIAVEIHQITADSSDISFDFELSLERFALSDALSIEKTTRINARVLDGVEWSPLESLIFTVEPPASSQNLVISEFSYRPAKSNSEEDPGGLYSRKDYEFIELTNISGSSISLAGIVFTDGVSFDFSNSRVLSLAAGDSLLIVENEAAFQARYPEIPLEKIAGKYQGELSNDGEQITLNDSESSVIRNFIYNDKSPWPEPADGSGYTLELKAPFSNPDHDQANNWRSSRGLFGTPDNRITSMTFDQWRQYNFTTTELSDPDISGTNADPDSDGFSNYTEFALGLQPNDPVSSISLPEAQLRSINDRTYLTLSYNEWAGAQNVSYEVQTSHLLEIWEGEQDLAVVEVGEPVDNGDGTVTRTFRSAESIDLAPRNFIRLKMAPREP